VIPVKLFPVKLFLLLTLLLLIGAVFGAVAIADGSVRSLVILPSLLSAMASGVLRVDR